jgi:hypothetical protein
MATLPYDTYVHTTCSAGSYDAVVHLALGCQPHNLALVCISFRLLFLGV